MRGSFSKLAAVATTALLSGTVALAQQPNPSPSPTCQRLEAQLTALDRGNADPQRAGQIRQAEDAVNRQQYQVDRLVAQSRHMGCEGSGFFSIFSNPPRACGPLRRQIDQARSTLEQMQNNLEQLNGGTAQRADQRQSLLIALGDNNCGAQYRSAARAGEQGGFFDRLFGGNSGGLFSSAPSGQMGDTYRTICVRTCDGYYFPLSFSTTPDHFREDAETCQRMCPAAQVQLYTYHNPGEDVSQAVSLNGQLYTQLPNAFKYRKTLSAACSCRRPGESWYEALKGTGPDESVAPGDIVTTEQNAKPASKPGTAAKGKPGQAPSSAQNKSMPSGSEPALAEAPGQIDPTKRKVRTVGPTFLQH